MADLYDILFPMPIVSTLSNYLGLEDVINLSRANSKCRAILHGFATPEPLSPIMRTNEEVRPSVYIGQHQTIYWKTLKAKSRKCVESFHTIGTTPEPCMSCSMFVCEACIVKVST